MEGRMIFSVGELDDSLVIRTMSGYADEEDKYREVLYIDALNEMKALTDKYVEKFGLSVYFEME